MMTHTPRFRSEAGFGLTELMIASLLTAVVMGVAFETFRDANALHENVVQISDSSQNLRAGTNLLVRDLMQAGRDLPTGGVSVPSGVGALDIHRPGPGSMFFDIDDTIVTIGAITTGNGLGPEVSGLETDIITILTSDPFLPALGLYTPDSPITLPRYQAGGALVDVADRLDWIEGDPTNGVAAIAKGDLIYFQGPNGSTLQTVTDVQDGVMSFAPGNDDPFNLNQPAAEAGSITQVLAEIPVPQQQCLINPPQAQLNRKCQSALSIRRVYMYTYYVDVDDDGVPRLMRGVNHATPQALAGVIEDLSLSYDLVNGDVNPTYVNDLPYEADDSTYLPSQIRKVNVHIGVRSETISSRTQDYLRSHLSTVISIRNLAYVDRYN